MKTPEEIKDALDTCGKRRICLSDCPYFGEEGCNAHLEEDAHDYIQQLERDKNWLSENYDLIREENKRLEAQVPKWISVEERIPRTYETVIVFVTGTDGCWYRNAAYHDGTRWRGYGSRLDTVLYWMPLPEPPKEEE